MATITLEYNPRNRAIQKALEGWIEGGVVKLIHPKNPSPSNDPYYDSPRNREAIEKGLADAAAGRTTPWEAVKKELGI